MTFSKYMIDYLSFLTKYYPNFHEIASTETANLILEEFDLIFNEENKLKIINKKKILLDNGYVEIFSTFKDDVDLIDKFYKNPFFVKNSYLDLQINDIDKNFILYKKDKK